MNSHRFLTLQNFHVGTLFYPITMCGIEIKDASKGICQMSKDNTFEIMKKKYVFQIFREMYFAKQTWFSQFLESIKITKMMDNLKNSFHFYQI